MPQNIQTFRERAFESGQIPLIDSFYGNIPSVIPITLGYWTDKLFTKIDAIEIICQPLNFRIEIAEPKSLINISDQQAQPIRSAKVQSSKKAKETRLKNGKRKEEG